MHGESLAGIQGIKHVGIELLGPLHLIVLHLRLGLVERGHELLACRVDLVCVLLLKIGYVGVKAEVTGKELVAGLGRETGVDRWSVELDHAPEERGVGG